MEQKVRRREKSRIQGKLHDRIKAKRRTEKRARLEKTKGIYKQKETSMTKDQNDVGQGSENQGDPIISSLSQFISTMTPIYTSKPIYTGGRIILSSSYLLTLCHGSINVFMLSQNSIDSNQAFRKVKHAQEEIVNFAISPHEKLICTFTSNYLLRLVSFPSLNLVQVWKQPNHFAYDIAFSPDSRYIALGHVNSIVKIYSTISLQETHTYRHHHFCIRKLDWLPSASNDILRILTACQEGILVLFDFVLNKQVARNPNGVKNFTLVTEIPHSFKKYLPSGRTASLTNGIILGTFNNEIRAFKAQNLDLLHKIMTQTSLDSIAASGSCLLTGAEDSGLFMLGSSGLEALTTGQDGTGVVKILATSIHTAATHSQIQSLSEMFGIVSVEQNITLLKGSLSSQGESEIFLQDILVGNNDEIIDLKTSTTECPSNYYILISNSPTLKIYNLEHHGLEGIFRLHNEIILAVEYFHPYLLTAGKDNLIKLSRIESEKSGKKLKSRWNIGCKEIAHYHGHTADITGLAVSLKSKSFWSVSEDKMLKKWTLTLDHDSAQILSIHNSLSTVKAHQKSINAVRISPKENLVATCSQDRLIKIWDTEPKKLKNPTSYLPEFTPFSTGFSKFTLIGHRKGVWDVTFHQIQAVLISCAADGMLKGWSLLDASCLWSMGEGSPLIRVSLLTHNQAVTASADGILKLWDLRKHQALSYDKHQGKIWALEILKTAQSTPTNQPPSLARFRLLTGDNCGIYHFWAENTNQTILKLNQEKQEIITQELQFSLLMRESKYIDAALLAFRADHQNLTLQALQKVICPFHKQTPFNLDSQLDQPTSLNPSFTRLGLGSSALDSSLKQNWPNKIATLSSQLFEVDPNRYLELLLSMNSTIRHFKMANILLNGVLGSKSYQFWANYHYTPIKMFIEKESFEGMAQGKSSWQHYLETMQKLTDRHLERLEKYRAQTYKLAMAENLIRQLPQIMNSNI